MFIPAAQAQAIFQAITCTPSTYSGAQVYSEVPLLQKWMNIMNLIYYARLTLRFILQKQILILVSWFYTDLWSAGCWFGSLACSLSIANPSQVLKALKS